MDRDLRLHHVFLVVTMPTLILLIPLIWIIGAACIYAIRASEPTGVRLAMMLLPPFVFVFGVLGVALFA